jgi:hypothetical protein
VNGKVLMFRRLPQFFLLALVMLSLACSRAAPTANIQPPTAQLPPAQTPAPTATPAFPNLQAELLDKRDKDTTSALGKFDFKNYTYSLPHGWQNPDGTDEITLTNGKVTPYAGTVSEDMSDEDKAAAKAQRRIGMSYVTAKYMDLTGDGQDEAIVILKVETEGSAIPQIGYIFSWKNNAPEMIWSFRTGDRADGGLKDIRSENGMMVVELYGQDRQDHGRSRTVVLSDILHPELLQVERQHLFDAGKAADILTDRPARDAARELRRHRKQPARSKGTKMTTSCRHL